MVVAPELTAGVKHQRAGVDMVGICDGGRHSCRHSPGHQPDAVIACPFSQLLLDRALTYGLGPIQITLPFAKQGKVLRQQHQQRLLFGQGRQFCGDLLPVILPVTARYQLYCG